MFDALKKIFSRKSKTKDLISLSDAVPTNPISFNMYLTFDVGTKDDGMVVHVGNVHFESFGEKGKRFIESNSEYTLQATILSMLTAAAKKVSITGVSKSNLSLPKSDKSDFSLDSILPPTNKGMLN